eukprot:2663193-Alexandrium_andersonii.AAC.1
MRKLSVHHPDPVKSALPPHHNMLFVARSHDGCWQPTEPQQNPNGNGALAAALAAPPELPFSSSSPGRLPPPGPPKKRFRRAPEALFFWGGVRGGR